ncbi:hypothetical protein QYF36_007324 [Acer negundo]|nr:hypothetical protein QYF36_007324 [Acer negundo]
MSIASTTCSRLNYLRSINSRDLTWKAWTRNNIGHDISNMAWHKIDEFSEKSVPGAASIDRLGSAGNATTSSPSPATANSTPSSPSTLMMSTPSQQLCV